MARSVNAIQQQLQDALVQYALEAGVTIDVTTWSKRNYLRLMTFAVAAVIAIFEQLLDVYQSIIEKLLAAGAPASPAWLQKKAFEFQYSATDPQVLIITGSEVPHYPAIRDDLKIITRASVNTTLSNNVEIKVAKSEPPTSLDVSELAAFSNYITDRGVAGINYTCISADADKIMISADVFFRGQFSAVILDKIRASLDAYYASLPFNGTLKIVDLEAAIRNTEGVNDVVLKDVRARKDTTAYASGTNLVLANELLERNWATSAGYIVEETEATHTLTDTLNLISE